MALYRYADQPYYFREDRAPRKTMINPSTNPISKPTLTLFINKPNAKPSMIAKINETSPLLAFGFLGVLIIIVIALRPFPENGFNVCGTISDNSTPKSLLPRDLGRPSKMLSFYLTQLY